MNHQDVRTVAQELRTADTAITEALKAAAGDVPPQWATDIAKARALLVPILSKSKGFCGRMEGDQYE